MSSKFQIKSRSWNVGVVVGSAVLLVLGFGALFLLRGSSGGAAGATMLLLVVLGVVTTLLFAGPGIVYSARKRVKVVKSTLPGGSMAWIRSHLYLPILALVAAFVHATAAPFRAYLSSGKVLLVLGVLVSISGVFRHHLIGLQKEALNVNVAINKLTTGQPRAFRTLVADFTDARRPLDQIQYDAARLDAPLQERWQKIRGLSDKVDKHFPRTGGQRAHVRHYKLWRALHPPLTIALFVVLGYHVFDVFGGSDAVLADDKGQFASSQQCAGCHTETFEEWSTSSMAHAQTSTITEAQLPITLAENLALAEELGDAQEEVFEESAKTCINCHAQVGSRFAEGIDSLLPLSDDRSAGVGIDGAAVSGGGDAVQRDGVGCIVCHTQEAVPSELAGAGSLTIDTGGAADYGTQYGPLFEDPGPLPVRVHGMGAGDDDYWDDTVESSQMCGACHNVKLDVDDDGELSDFTDADEGLDDEDARSDEDADFQLDQNELDDSDDDGAADDLVLQTTFDEWQDYVVGFEERFEDDDRQTLAEPLGCNECHMPTSGDGTRGVVENAPGILSVPERQYRSHSFVGVDYDLDPGAYEGHGIPEGAREDVLAEREALLQSAITLEVVDPGVVAGDVFAAEVVVRNNLLAHSFPTGFAFARQFWLEVTALTAAGDPVCLATTVDGIPTPCGSGVVEEVDEDLRQCDNASVIELVGLDPGNGDVTFAPGAAFPADDCDPWLVNFQKILTDGDEGGVDGEDDLERQEVPYQPFLPDAVQNRNRVADGQPVTELQPVRLRCVDPGAENTDEGPCTQDDGDPGILTDDSFATFAYEFDTSQVADGEEVTVTARMRFRHLPPYFVRDLEDRQEDLDDDVPEDARIDADELLANMVITDVVEARSNEGEQLACTGPQNEEGASIFDCLDEGEGVALGAAGVAREEPRAKGAAVLPEAPLLVLGAGVAALVRRRRRRRRSGP